MSCILHIETSTSACSVAVSEDGQNVFKKEDLNGPSHAVSLGVFVDEALSFADSHAMPLDAVAVSCGPGSYTGLRIGVSMAKDKETFEKAASKRGPFFFGSIIGLLFMGITQLPAVKEMPFIFQNLLSLFTVFPLAIAVLTITKRHLWLVNNWVLEQIGLVSFEIYLVHPFMMENLQMSITSLAAFLGVTAVCAWLLHMLIRKGNQIWSI